MKSVQVYDGDGVDHGELAKLAEVKAEAQEKVYDFINANRWLLSKNIGPVQLQEHCQQLLEACDTRQISVWYAHIRLIKAIDEVDWSRKPLAKKEYDFFCTEMQVLLERWTWIERQTRIEQDKLQ